MRKGWDHRARLPVNYIAAMSTPPSQQPAWHREQVEAVTGGHLRQPPMPQQQPPPPQPNRPQPTWPTQRYSPQYVPTQAHTNPTVRPGLRTWLGGGAIGVVSLFLALLFALFIGYSSGVVATLMGLVFALIPLVIVLPIFLWLDRLEAEPWQYLVTAFLYGALGSTFLALFVSLFFDFFLIALTDPASADRLSGVLIAPPVEESFKGVFILIMWAVARKRFNGITDGIVYAGVVAAGFAFTENIMYLADALQRGGYVGFAGTFFIRGILSPFGHPIYTSMTGIGIGIAATTRSAPLRFVAPVAGWSAGVVLHALWNFSVSFGLIGLIVALGVYFVVFGCFVGFVVRTRFREAQIITEHLRPYVATGWLAPAELSMLSSMPQRRQARSWARQFGGPGRLKAMRAFQDTASELALLRFRMTRHFADPETLHRELVLLDSMTARRREFAGVG